MINLLLAIHNHQPVGNFDNVFQDAFEKSYLPFIEVVERHPKIKFSLHYTGSLLDWLVRHQPDFLTRIKKLVKDGQVEIFAGGYYEPILTLIPERDAIRQSVALKEKVKEIFGYESHGAWIAERVWEPKMPIIFSKSKLDYGIVDDSHFALVGKEPQQLNGFYKTEDEGYSFNLFPCCEQLRYDIPFGEPEKTIEYLRGRNHEGRDVAITYGDDGEKFGLWPGTYDLVYTRGWLDRFLTALEANESWIKTMTFQEYVKAHQATDRIYLPCASYREMLEWSKGFYRNFMVKYPEINAMHKRMIYLSDKIHAAKSVSKEAILKARKYLFMGQANDAYWHGAFGGLYLNHLRSAVYQNLIKADVALEQAQKKKSAAFTIKREDIDCDGQKEVTIRTKNNNFYLKPTQGAALFGWDCKHKMWNLINTVNRREELYHKKIREKHLTVAAGQAQGEVKSIHDRFVEKEKGLENFLFYDKNPRHCLVDHFLPLGTDVQQMFASRYEECGDFASNPYGVFINHKASKPGINFKRRGRINNLNASILKKVSSIEKGLDVSYAIANLENDQPIETLFAVEFNFSVHDPNLFKTGKTEGCDRFEVVDSWNSFRIQFSLSQKGDFYYYPVETVSDSEMGIEKTYQELCVIAAWPIKILPETKWSVDFKLTI